MSILSKAEDFSMRVLGVNKTAQTVHAEANSSGLPVGSQQGDHQAVGSPMDAYRHILISAELTRQYGETRGNVSGILHEWRNTLSGDQTPKDKTMDDHNNAIGVGIGKVAKTWDDVVRMARQAVTQGASYGGTGENGTAHWYEKPEDQNWKPNWEGVPVTPNAKGGEEHRSWFHDNPGSGTRGLIMLPKTLPSTSGGTEKPDGGSRQNKFPQGAENWKLPETTLDGALRKPHTLWSEAERNIVQTAVLEMPSSDPRRNKADALVRAWFTHFYGNQPLQYDPTGRMIQPRPIRPIPGSGGSGGGEVHVEAYDRSQDGATVHVRSHMRGRPG